MGPPKHGHLVNLQGFRTRAPEDDPFAMLCATGGSAALNPAWQSSRVRRELGAAVARQGLRAAGPATGSV